MTLLRHSFRNRPWLNLLAFTVTLAISISLRAQTADARIGHVLSELGKVRNLHQTAISPDGRTLAWVVDTAPGGNTGTEIEVAPLTAPEKPTRVTAATKGELCDESSIAWSPDSKTLAFLSDCADKAQSDFYLAQPGAKSAPRRLTHLHGIPESPAFSPDGKEIGFLYVEGATRRASPLAAEKPPTGVIGEEGLEIKGVWTVGLWGGHIYQVTPTTLYTYEFDWSPDSKHLAYIAAPPPGENNWWVAQLYTQPLGEKPASILDPANTPGPLHGLQIAIPRWSPDGKHIAFIGGLMSDQGATGGDIYLLPLKGGETRNITSDAQTTSSWFEWAEPQFVSGELPSSIYTRGGLNVSQIRGGQVEIVRIDPATGKTNTVYSSLPASIGDGRLELSLSTSSDGTIAYILGSFSQPPAVFAGKLGATAQPITHYNDALKPAWGKGESVTWTSPVQPSPTIPANSDLKDFNVQGWLLYPADYDPAKKYPLIVYVHGGPSSATLPHWPRAGYGPVPFVALGYFVLMPNPRGSYGQGEAFTQANRKDFGYGDLRDILAGVDAVTHSHNIDPERVGLTGWSYGGFMTMFAVTQTNRFRAAVAGAGIANWQSYYAENSIDQWMIPFMGASVYDDPGVYAKMSAVNFIHSVKTPTLAVVGDRDGECPAPQSFEFWHALKAQHVPTQLVVYPNEGHGFVDPEHQRDVIARALGWFEKYMPAQ
jgi:dipeptidyl aminopeptidase/acylaminoacyl peptidase